jgi:DNA-binding response OmpR family regulator
MKTILIADDDAAIRKLLSYQFKAADFAVTLAKDGQEALEAAEKKKFDLLLFDVMMPYLTGIELTNKLRQAGNLTPILILTAREDDEARLRGLDVGADDYLDKTTAMAEIIQRARGLIRRHQEYDKHAAAPSGKDFRIDEKHKTVFAENQEIELTKREFDILQLLVNAEGKIVSRDQLLQAFWGLTTDVAETRTIDVLVSRLRKKLGNRYIKSKRGFGYYFDENFKA